MLLGDYTKVSPVDVAWRRHSTDALDFIQLTIEVVICGASKRHRQA